MIVSYTSIKYGNIKDPYYPYFYRKGYLGEISIKNHMYEYGIWMNLLKRCYDDTYEYNFGKNNITICLKWLSFKNFLDDIKLIENYDDILFNNKKLILYFKDEFLNINKNINNIEYSINNCKWIEKKKLKKIIKVCEVCGLTEKEEDIIHYQNKIYLCRRHLSQMDLYGHILDRTKFDKNEIILHDDYAEILIYNKKNNIEPLKCKIDLEDINRVNNYKWCVNDLNYVFTHIDGNKRLRIHRLIMNIKDSNKVIDHINHDTLDNRKENLRICKQSDNTINKCLQSNNKYGVAGIVFNKKIKKWQAVITFHKKVHHLGFFKNFEDAKQARLEAEVEYFGDYRYKPEEDIRNIKI